MKLVIFSGTGEGHDLCRFLSGSGQQAEVFVATEYGQAVMEPMPGITVHQGRLAIPEMAGHFSAETLVVDATHPYASQVTANIRTACAQSGAEYLRLLRPRIAAEDVVSVPDTAVAVAWLSAHTGKALLTTGSKELEAYTAVPDYAARLYPRVLPSASVLQKCETLGFPGAHILAMQGPFSHAMNVALLQQIGAKILVTKDTGDMGGFAEKLSAARETGATVLMIARPTDESGMPLQQVKQYLADRLGLKPIPRFPLFISLAGKKVLVAGAGQIAARRVQVLQRFGAEVILVAPEKRCDIHHTVYLPRGFQQSDLEGVFLAVAATDNREVNHTISILCASRNIPVSVADCAAESTFFFPAVCEGNGLVAGLVSDGARHHAVSTAAKQIRILLEGSSNG